MTCPCCPAVSPPLCMPCIGAGSSQDRTAGVDSSDEPLVNQRHALFGEPIIGHDVTLGEFGEGARPAIPMPCPKSMTPAAWAAHCMSHLPFDPACPYCAACKRLNVQHRSSHEHERRIPLVVADYCFPKTSDDKIPLTVLVARVYPYKIIFAMAVPNKGQHP